MTFATRTSKACLLILGYLTIYSFAADTVHICPPHFHGVLPHSHNCRVYIDCLYGIPEVLQCPPNEVFYPEKMECVPEKIYPECESDGFIRFDSKEK